MNLQKSIERIIELFLIFRQEVKSHNEAGLFDINRLSEDVLVPVFKDAFDCQYLRNLNREQKNYPGLDLADDQSRIAFQITSDAGIEKIKDTLRKIVAEKHYLRYETFYIYILTEKQRKYAKKPLQDITRGYFSFDPAMHIIDSSDVRARVEKLDYEFIQRVEQTLEVHFSRPAKYFVRSHTPTKTETLTLNLMPITFPKEVYIAKVNYDRREVIERSWERDFKIPLDSGERDVARAALEQKGLKFSADWVVRSNEIITFRDLRDETLPLTAIVDPASADPIPVDRYIRKDNGELNIDRVNIMKDLLRNTLRTQLYHRGIVWQHEAKLFIFIDPDGGENRKEYWSGSGKKKEGRVVYHKVRDKEDHTKVWFHEHVAFEAGFDLYDGQWYLAIKPDWFCSYDGYNKSDYQNKNRVAYLKRNAYNSDVLVSLQFIVEILLKDQKEALLKHDLGPRIMLNELVTLDGAPPINDDEWLQQEEKKKRKALSNSEKATEAKPLFGLYASENDT